MQYGLKSPPRHSVGLGVSSYRTVRMLVDHVTVVNSLAYPAHASDNRIRPRAPYWEARGSAQR
eukprot:4845385-Prymnesium_polylepis.1